MIATSRAHRTHGQDPGPDGSGSGSALTVSQVQKPMPSGIDYEEATGGVRAGLVALVGLTAWAVASVSVWWVLAYLAALVSIFITPRGRRPWAMASEARAESGGAGLGQGMRVDCMDRVDQHHSAVERGFEYGSHRAHRTIGFQPGFGRIQHSQAPAGSNPGT